MVIKYSPVTCAFRSFPPGVWSGYDSRSLWPHWVRDRHDESSHVHVCSVQQGEYSLGYWWIGLGGGGRWEGGGVKAILQDSAEES